MSQEKLLLDKVAIITGGARGIGEAHVRKFVEHGANVIVADILDEEGASLAQELGGNANYLHLDVSDAEQWQNVIESTVKDLGKVDVLINNAAILHIASISETRPEDYMKVIQVNQFGTFLGMQAVIPAMKQAQQGSIINISSTGALLGINGLVAYNASKWAVRGMTKVAATELGQYGIRVNSIHPGVVKTAMAKSSPKTKTGSSRKTPIPRAAEPEEIANMSLFLASDMSLYCTGSEFIVDGGVSQCQIIDSYPEADADL